MRIRLSFIKHILWAVVWLISLICCIEVGLRVHTFLDDKPVSENAQVERVACHQVHHHLKPLEKMEFQHPDTGHQFTERLNSFGLRGPEPSLEKSDDVIRILCLGDEMTFGPGLTTPELFTTQLESLLKDYMPKKLEVINAGVPGYCPLLSLLQYRHRLRALNPDVIVLTFEMGDVADDYLVRGFTTHDENGFPLGCRNPLLGNESELKKVTEPFCNDEVAKGAGGRLANRIVIRFSRSNRPPRRQILRGYATTLSIGALIYKMHSNRFSSLVFLGESRGHW